MSVISTNDLAERLTSELRASRETIDILFKALNSSLKQNAEALDSVAIPGFGTFMTQKYEERVVDDTDDGQSTLLPPSIEMQFKSSVVMRKKILG